MLATNSYPCYRSQNRKTLKGGYLFPEAGGCVYNGRLYTEHALERMAPETEEIFNILFVRAKKRMMVAGLRLAENQLMQTNFNQNWWQEFIPKMRGISPSEIEREIQQPGSTDLRVKIAENEAIVTAYRRAKTKESLFSKRMFRIMQEKAQRIEREIFRIELPLPRVQTKLITPRIQKKLIFSDHSIFCEKARELLIFESEYWVHEHKEINIRRRHQEQQFCRSATHSSRIQVKNVPKFKTNRKPTYFNRSQKNHSMLETSFQKWEKQMKESKRKRRKKIDIANWKAMNKLKCKKITDAQKDNL